MVEAIPVLINRGGGTASARGDRLAAELEQAFAAAGLAVDLQLVDGCDMAKAAAAVADRSLVAVGGGDGTIGCAAGALLRERSRTTLAVLPLGTRNHFARELGLPDDLAEVAKAIAAGAFRAVDVGELRGGDDEVHVFVNNASVGFYPEMVRRRDAVRRARGLPKWAANLPAAWAVLKRARHHRLRLRLDGRERTVRTPLLFVGNNRYELERGRVGTRASLEDGLLSVFAVRGARPLALAGFALRTLAGRADPTRDFAALGEVAELEVEVHGEGIDVALDGEVVRLAGPLCFAIRPGAIRVIVAGEAASDAERDEAHAR